MKEQTLSIIKPDGVKINKIGYILRKFEDAGFMDSHFPSGKAKSALKKHEPGHKTVEDYLKEGFSQREAEQMSKNQGTTGKTKKDSEYQESWKGGESPKESLEAFKKDLNELNYD